MKTLRMLWLYFYVKFQGIHNSYYNAIEFGICWRLDMKLKKLPYIFLCGLHLSTRWMFMIDLLKCQFWTVVLFICTTILSVCFYYYRLYVAPKILHSIFYNSIHATAVNWKSHDTWIHTIQCWNEVFSFNWW